MININSGVNIQPGMAIFSEYFSVGSLAFSSSSSAITNGPVLGSGAFTIEYWVKHGAGTTLPTIFLASETGAYTGSNTRNTVFMEIGSSSIWQAGSRGTTQMANPTAWTSGSWQHVVLVRSSAATNNYTAFYNGVRSTTGVTTDSRNYDQPFTSLGYWSFPPANKFMNGNFAGIRITVGNNLFDPNAGTIPVPVPTRDDLANPQSTAQTKLLMTVPEYAPFTDFSKNCTLTAQNGTVTYSALTPY